MVCHEIEIMGEMIKRFSVGAGVVSVVGWFVVVELLMWWWGDGILEKKSTTTTIEHG